MESFVSFYPFFSKSHYDTGPFFSYQIELRVLFFSGLDYYYYYYYLINQ